MKKQADPETESSGRRPTRPLTLILLLAAVIVAGAVLLTLRGEDGSPAADSDAAPVASLNLTERAAVYLPAEFDPQESLLLGGTQLVSLFPDVLAEIVRAVGTAVPLRVLVGSATDHARVDSIATANRVALEILDIPVRTMWVRDFGPLTVSDTRGRRHLVDFHYRERRGNKTDNGVPGEVGLALGLPVETSPLLVEGGDLLTNGRGFCLVSTRVVNRNAHYLEFEPAETINNLAALLGFEGVSLARPLVGESTGHVDMFAAFVAADLVVVGQYAAGVDEENEVQLTRLAADLATRQTLVGPLRVERVPLPDHDDGVWRTYTNLVFANDVVLVPIYPDYCPDLDAVALATYRRLLPERKIVGIPAGALIRMNGALRCITMNVPRAGRLAAPSVTAGAPVD